MRNRHADNEDSRGVVGALHKIPSEVAAGLKILGELITCVGGDAAVLGAPDCRVRAPFPTTPVVEAISTPWDLYKRGQTSSCRAGE